VENDDESLNEDAHPGDDGLVVNGYGAFMQAALVHPFNSFDYYYCFSIRFFVVVVVVVVVQDPTESGALLELNSIVHRIERQTDETVGSSQHFQFPLFSHCHDVRFESI
jgi:hypothetical protein